jgi:hypothetical protein
MAKTNIARLRFGTAIVDPLRSLSAALFDHYRPELHYMRGPGPKWREKHCVAARRLGAPRPAPLARFAPHEGEFNSSTTELGLLFHSGTQERRKLGRAMVTTCR